VFKVRRGRPYRRALRCSEPARLRRRPVQRGCVERLAALGRGGLHSRVAHPLSAPSAVRLIRRSSGGGHRMLRRGARASNAELYYCVDRHAPDVPVQMALEVAVVDIPALLQVMPSEVTLVSKDGERFTLSKEVRGARRRDGVVRVHSRGGGVSGVCAIGLERGCAR
jgi:hypothetical protein